MITIHTRNHGGRKLEEKLMNKTSKGPANDDYLTYKEAEIRALTRDAVHRFCVNCVKLAVKLLDGTLPNCLKQGCTSRLSVDTCGKLLTPDMSLRWKEMTKEELIPYNERVYCPYERCSYLMSRTELVLVSACGHGRCFKCGGSFCYYCKAPWHGMLSCTDYKKRNPDTQNAKVISLANRNGWRQCGKCNHMVERSNGCRNMTCR
ncbi:unnamed protein product [Eruca vesicaria subsp. sativa]|uniref:RBR-type E3 ubiquitin transferase n=1 Tax=Eruca vesicaria subsp. sativa TaxID=29727 RepID=A0ABC8JJN4_ERUVS|nr:unnamed protein product [Eruca vesicaria subsp. sativa]